MASASYASAATVAAAVLALGLNPLSSGSVTLAVAAMGLLNSLCMVLCFMPPRRYLDWLERRAAAGQRG